MMTEREAWTAIADTLEMTGELPPFNSYEPCYNLFAVTHVMLHDRLISCVTHHAMRERMSHAWAMVSQFAPHGDVGPRILWARIFADACK